MCSITYGGTPADKFDNPCSKVTTQTAGEIWGSHGAEDVGVFLYRLKRRVDL
jgi:hypothetical protein